MKTLYFIINHKDAIKPMKVKYQITNDRLKTSAVISAIKESFYSQYTVTQVENVTLREDIKEYFSLGVYLEDAMILAKKARLFRKRIVTEEKVIEDKVLMKAGELSSLEMWEGTESDCHRIFFRFKTQFDAEYLNKANLLGLESELLLALKGKLEILHGRNNCLYINDIENILKVEGTTLKLYKVEKTSKEIEEMI